MNPKNVSLPIDCVIKIISFMCPWERWKYFSIAPGKLKIPYDIQNKISELSKKLTYNLYSSTVQIDIQNHQWTSTWYHIRYIDKLGQIAECLEFFKITNDHTILAFEQFICENNFFVFYSPNKTLRIKNLLDVLDKKYVHIPIDNHV